MDQAQPTGLSERQHQAVRELLLQPSLRRVALELEINESTLRRWLNEPEFKLELEKARRAALQTALDQLRSSAEMAAKTLRDVMGNTSAAPSARVAAAVAVFRGAASSFGLDKQATAYAQADARKCPEMSGFPKKQAKSA
jgi:hypothetical protein